MSWQEDIDKKVEKHDQKYKCHWCKHEFVQRVGRGYGQCKRPDSSQVQCPQCKNFIPTWE